MQRAVGGGVTKWCWVAMARCATVVPTPGANHVRLTRNSAEVAGCTPVGNINWPSSQQGMYAAFDLRNRVVGYGGNAGLKSSIGDP